MSNQQQAIIDAIPFPTSYINFPVYLEMYKPEDDGVPTSELTVLMDALSMYKQHTVDRPVQDDETKQILDMLDDMRETLYQIMAERLSDASVILHKQKNNLT